MLTIFLNNRMLLGFLPPSQECSRRAALTRADAEGATTTRTNENRVETDNKKRNGKPELLECLRSDVILHLADVKYFKFFTGELG